MTTLDTSGIVLVADSGQGVVYRVDTSTGKYSVAVNNTLMAPIQPGIGVNGIHIRDGALHFTSSSQGIFGRVPIFPNGTASGAAVVVAHNGFGDDFTFDRAGNAYVAQGTLNTVQKITPSGKASIVAGNLNSSTLAGATSTHFGRTLGDEGVLYVTTNGGIQGPVNGTYIEGGKVVAIRGVA